MNLPPPAREYDVNIAGFRNLELEQADQQNHKKRQDVEIGAARLVLESPNGTRYSVTVDNSGNLSASSL